MTRTDEADANDTWVGALRSDYQPAPQVARERVAARLAGAGLLAIAVGGATSVSKTAQRGFLYSKAFVALATLPAGILMGAAGHAWLAPPAVAAAVLRGSTVPPVVAAVTKAVERREAAESTLARPVAAEPWRGLVPVNPQPVTPKARLSNGEAPAAERLEIARDPAAPEPELPGLELELRLLERARSKLSEGQPGAALELLRQHRAQYPQSALEQEREALSVRVLMAAGQRAEARKQAAAFAERYPKSVLRGSVERAVGTIP